MATEFNKLYTIQPKILQISSKEVNPCNSKVEHEGKDLLISLIAIQGAVPRAKMVRTPSIVISMTKNFKTLLRKSRYKLELRK